MNSPRILINRYTKEDLASPVDLALPTGLTSRQVRDLEEILQAAPDAQLLAPSLPLWELLKPLTRAEAPDGLGKPVLAWASWCNSDFCEWIDRPVSRSFLVDNHHTLVQYPLGDRLVTLTARRGEIRRLEVSVLLPGSMSKTGLLSADGIIPRQLAWEGSANLTLTKYALLLSALRGLHVELVGGTAPLGESSEYGVVQYVRIPHLVGVAITSITIVQNPEILRAIPGSRHSLDGRTTSDWGPGLKL